MRKLMLIVLCLLLFMVVPKYSNTSVTSTNMTDVEKQRLIDNVNGILTAKKIDKEYVLFYDNLNTVKTPKFTTEFIQRLMCEAITSKSLPSISIAQAVVETGYGRHMKLKNNIFGIKGKGIKTKTKEFYKGRFITITSEFQYFPTLEDAFNRHYEILNRYGVKGYDYKQWIDRIMIHGYATDPQYDWKLNYVIEKFQLYRLDKIQLLNEKNTV